MTVKVFFRSGPLQGAIHWDGEEAEPKTFTLTEAGQSIPIDLKVSDKCDEVNREDGSCVDYAYVQIWNNDPSETKPVAGKPLDQFDPVVQLPLVAPVQVVIV